MASLRIGIIGAGAVAREIHVPGYRATTDAEVVAVASGSRASAGRLASAAGIARVHDTVDALLADPEIDAVSICTPPATHRGLVEAALGAGKHVLVEKPIATSLSDLDAVVAVAAAAPFVVDVVRNERFMDFNRIVREVVADGAIGRPLSILQTISTTGPEAWAPVATWFRDASIAGGGALLDLGVHKVDQAAWIADRSIVPESARALRPDDGVEELALLSFELEDSITCAVHTSWKGPADEASIVVAGSHGVLTGVWSTGRIQCHGRVSSTWSAPVPWSSADLSATATMSDFVQNCLGGRRPIDCDRAWDSGTRAVLMAYAAGKRR